MPAEAIAAGTQFVITLLSDAILRSEDGSLHTDLSRALQAMAWAVTPVRTFAKIVAVGGFNRKWGLPLPQTWAVRAGSVFVMQATSKIAKQQVDDILTNGLGERRVDGFGRLAIDWQANGSLTQVRAGKPGHPPAKDAQAAQPAVLSGEAEALAMQMALRRRRRDLDQALMVAINHSEIKKAPRNSQLSRVRVVARDALVNDELGRIAELFQPTLSDSHDPNPQALKGASLQQFEDARLDGMALSAWISQLATQPNSVWDRLGGEYSVALGAVNPQGFLAKEYAVRLIDGVLDKTMAERRKKGED